VDPVARDAAALTPAWLSAALGRTITGVAAEAIGTGQMGASWRLTLSSDEPGPKTLVAKLAAGDAAARARVSFGFQKEVGFYTDLAATLDVRTPGCFYGAITDDGADFTLLLEDLAPSVPGVQADSCRVDQAIGAVRNLAALHAPRWNDASLREHAFLSPIDEGIAELFGAALVPATEVFVDRYESGLGVDDVATLRAAAAVIVPWMLDRPDPFAVVHGDYRLDNLMFPPTGDAVAALDWQSVSVGAPGRDLAYFVGTTFAPEDRRRCEDDLVTAYHDELMARGVRGYDRGRCADDYRAGHLQGPLITVLGAIHATAPRSERADGMFLAMATRSCAAIRDLHALDVVRARPLEDR
jgi:hypothetical protein